jgi:hypothetical protein
MAGMRLSLTLGLWAVILLGRSARLCQGAAPESNAPAHPAADERGGGAAA